MKQHNASPQKGSQAKARKGSPKAAARKPASAKAPARAKKAAGKPTARPVSKARAPRSAVVQLARAAPAGLVKLPSECLIGSLDGLRTQLVECVAIETPVSLDAAAVERVDTAALQLLAAFTRDRRATGLALAWTAVSASLADAASLLNLTSVLALEVDDASVKVAA